MDHEVLLNWKQALISHTVSFLVSRPISTVNVVEVGPADGCDRNVPSGLRSFAGEKFIAGSDSVVILSFLNARPSAKR